MTWEERKYCREAALAELRSTGKEGIEDLIRKLDEAGFFTSGCKGHDEAEGGAVSHALWTLHFAREIVRRKAGETRKEAAGEDESEAPAMVPDAGLIMATIGQGTSERPSGKNSEGPADGISEACKAVIDEAEEMAVAYCDCIPFGTKPIEVAEPEEMDEWIDCVLDSDDHRLWTGGDDEFYESIGNSSSFPCHLVMTLTVRGKDCGAADLSEDECDVAILSDDIGGYTLMLLSSEDGEDALFRSDRRVFAYTGMVFYITRYPQYRSSYVALRNAKGKWGLVALRDDRKRRSGHLLAEEKVVDFVNRSPGKAAWSLRSRNGGTIGITHPDFYTKISVG